MPETRMACLSVPLFPLAAWLRSEPELREDAAAVFEGRGQTARLVGATRAARRHGVAAGMTLAQATTRLPGLVALGRDAERERAASDALHEVAGSFSPRLEQRGEGVLLVDLAGLDLLVRNRRLHGHQEDESSDHVLGRAIEDAGSAVGLPIRVGIAGSALAARVASDLPKSPTIVPPGADAVFLTPLPLQRLRSVASGIEESAIEGILAALLRWGITTIGDFARLREADVTERLGQSARKLHAMARGRDPEPFVADTEPLRVREGMIFEWTVTLVEPLLFAVRGALERILARLALCGVACREFTIDLNLDPEGQDVRTITLPAPTREVTALVAVLRLDLERRPPRAPVTGFAMTAYPGVVRTAAQSLFGPSTVSPDRLAGTLARVATLVGPENIGSPETVDGNLPERESIGPFTPPPTPILHHPVRKGRGFLAVRVLRPAVPLDVTVSEDSSRPVHLTSSRPEVPDPRTPSIEGRVRVASGPWACEEGWWKESAAARDYWDVEVEGGVLYRIFRDRETQAWFADGVYD